MVPAKLVGIALVAVVVVALFAVQVDVPSINTVDGAFAFAQPTLSVTFSGDTSTTTVAATAPSKGTPTLVVEPHPYIVPKPTKRSLWQILFPPGCLTPDCSGSSLFDGSTGGCSVLSSTNRSVTVHTYAKLSIVGPGGQSWQFRTDNESTNVQQQVKQLSCPTISGPRTGWSWNTGVSYDLGTFYFTNGRGIYSFTAEVWLLNDSGGLDVKLGSTQLAVNAT